MTNPYVFYYVMKYPLPLEDEKKFLKFDLKSLPDFADDSFENINPRRDILEDLIAQIKKYQHLLADIPFLKWAFVVNSISFRGVHNNSDIDLFLVVQKNRLWIARLYAWWIFRKIRTTKSHKYKRFCLSFWVEEDQLELKNMSLAPIDIYLIYWIAHAVPIFSRGWNVVNFYIANKWIKEFLPWWQPKQIIDLNIPLLVKKVNKTNRLIDNIFGNVTNSMIYILWRPLMLIKAYWNGESLGVGTIIKKGVVKIHKDIRQQVIGVIWK